jgi:hypothetical protein
MTKLKVLREKNLPVRPPVTLLFGCVAEVEADEFAIRRTQKVVNLLDARFPFAHVDQPHRSARFVRRQVVPRWMQARLWSAKKQSK